jgi:hypothetical protein
MSEKHALSNPTSGTELPGAPPPNLRLPRVLFVSVNPFSQTSNNGKTFASFFEGYPVDSLAQLYFHREIPSSPVCENYFRITDEHLLHEIFRPWRVTGERVSSLSTSETPIPPSTHTVLKESRTARLLRQILWTQIRFNNPELLSWLDDFRPEVVFFCGGDAASLYPKTTFLADRYGASLVFYITDDYVLPFRSLNPAAQLSRAWTRRVFKRITARSDLVLTIGESMSMTYEREFGVVSTPIMNMISVPASKPASRGPRAGDSPLVLLYAGSLHSNRWRVLAKLADSIERLAAQGVPARLRIFGPEPTPEMRAAIHRPPHSEHGGLLTPAELEAAVAGADTLVHVESDDPASMTVTALSVSTKIPEYLASGRSVLAIGPPRLASIEYLASHEVAIVVDPGDEAGLDRAIESLAYEPGVHDSLVTRAFALARANHDGPKTRRLLWTRLEELVP